MKVAYPWMGLLAFVLGMPAAGTAPVAAAADLTPQYQAAWRRDCAFGAAHTTLLRRHKVLLVSGYFADIDPKYFADHLQWLASLGVEAEKVAVKSRQSIAVNAPIVAAAIRGSAKPVLLVTHSKGSVDALDALLAEPALRSKVNAWVSLQGAFGGSPIADWLLNGSLLDPATGITVLQFFGGSKESLEGLTTTASRERYNGREPAIETLLRAVPTIAFASSLDGPQARSSGLLEISRLLMSSRGVRSDGLVPPGSALLPGMDYVEVTGVDHVAPVMPALEPFDRVRMMRALLLAMRGPFRGLPVDAGCPQPPGK
jgi:hypothetical protein